MKQDNKIKKLEKKLKEIKKLEKRLKEIRKLKSWIRFIYIKND